MSRMRSRPSYVHTADDDPCYESIDAHVQHCVENEELLLPILKASPQCNR